MPLDITGPAFYVRWAFILQTFDFRSNIYDRLSAHSALHDLHGTWICTVKGVKDMYVLVFSDGFPLMFTPDSCLAIQTLPFHQQSVTFWWPNLLVKRLHLQHLCFLLCPSPTWVVHKVKLLVLNWYLPMYSPTRQIFIGLMQSELEKRECLNHMPKVVQIRTET